VLNEPILHSVVDTSLCYLADLFHGQWWSLVSSLSLHCRLFGHIRVDWWSYQHIIPPWT